MYLLKIKINQSILQQRHNIEKRTSKAIATTTFKVLYADGVEQNFSASLCTYKVRKIAITST